MKYLLILLILFAPLIVYASDDLSFTQGQKIDLKANCLNNRSFCSSSASCNLTAYYPNNTLWVNNSPMSNNYNFFNYTLPNSEIIGVYSGLIVCKDGTYQDYQSFNFKISRLGQYNTPSWVIVLSLGIIAALLIYISQALENIHVILKVFFTILSLLIIFLGIPYSLVSDGTIYTLLRIGSWVFYLTMAYIMLFLILWVLEVMGWVKLGITRGDNEEEL